MSQIRHTFSLAGIIRDGMVSASSRSLPEPSHTFMKSSRLSFLSTITLCVLALFVSMLDASAQDAPVIGTLRFERPRCIVLVNKVRRASGYAVRNGDIVQTFACKAEVDFIDGGRLVINPNSRVRVYLQGRTVIAAILVGGGNYFPPSRPGPNDIPVIVQQGDSDSIESQPYLGAFSFGNFSGSSVGGGGGSSSGGTTTGVLPNGKIGLFNSFGVLIREL